jgi:hypothetical protein
MDGWMDGADRIGSIPCISRKSSKFQVQRGGEKEKVKVPPPRNTRRFGTFCLSSSSQSIDFALLFNLLLLALATTRYHRVKILSSGVRESEPLFESL